MNNKSLLLLEAVQTIRDLRNEIEELQEKNEALEKKLLENDKLILSAKKAKVAKIYKENQDYAK